MKIMIHLTEDDIREKIPYAIICETMYGSRWNTGRRRRLMKQEFSESEIKAIHKMRPIAHKWHLVTGAPLQGAVMHPNTFTLWQRLGNFCASLS